MSRRTFSLGDPAPNFICRAPGNPRFKFDTTAGRYLVISFFGSCGFPAASALLQAVAGKWRHIFDDDHCSFFGVSIDPADETRLKNLLPGIRWFWDDGAHVSALYGAMEAESAEGPRHYYPFTLVLDPLMRTLAMIPLGDPERHNAELEAVLTALPPPESHAGAPLFAPVLMLPRVFEPEFCRTLIELYDTQGGAESGVMREQNGMTEKIYDYGFKRRKDFPFEAEPDQEPLRAEIRARLTRRLVPEIRRAFAFEVTRIERYLVCCYESETQGFFSPHRDNTTKGTAHRRFACTINLNAEDYEGGDLIFPEFGPRRYRAPTGGAVVFSCSLLHEVKPVTKGQRYAFLPFFYDDAAAKIRAENLAFLKAE